MSIGKDIKNTWEGVTTIVRGTLYLAAIGFVGYKAYRWYKVLQIENAAQELKDKIDTYEKAGIKPTYLDSYYKKLSDDIFKGGEAALGFNTDEEKIYGAFRMLKNDLDFAKLQAYTYTIGLVWKETYNLQEWIERVLDEPEIVQINNILKSKRINYLF
jgi:HPt (histidine-containing phosphotransfer) domain-containing protein